MPITLEFTCEKCIDPETDKPGVHYRVTRDTIEECLEAWRTDGVIPQGDVDAKVASTGGRSSHYFANHYKRKGAGGRTTQFSVKES